MTTYGVVVLFHLWRGTGVYRPGPTDDNRHDVVMTGVPLPLGLSRLFRNIPQRHNKVVTDF